MSTFSDFLGGATDFLNQTATTIGTTLDTVAQAKFNWADKNLTIASKQADIQSKYADIATQQYTNSANQQLLKIQADNALKAAQNGANLTSVSQYSNDSVSQTLANLNTRISNLSTGSGSSSLVTWLTVAGVAFAALQYFKGAK